MLNRIFCIALLFFAILQGGCNLVNPDVTVPSYIHIDSISLVTDYSRHGSASHRITDAWVYVNNDLQGVYELPVTFPVIADGDRNILIRPGIIMNGISATRSYYPFYDFIEYNVTLKPKETVTLNPTASYFPGSNIWIEDFESPGFKIERTNVSDTTVSILRITGTDSFEGNGSGFIRMPAGATIFEAATVATFSFPRDGSPVYLEMNYKINYPLTIGLIAHTTTQVKQESVIRLNPAEVWKKIYINLSGAVVAAGPTLNFKIFFGAVNDGSVESPEFFLDNIKVLYP